MRYSSYALLVLLPVCGTGRTNAQSEGCEPSWLPRLGAPPGVQGGAVKALLVHDDGSGPELWAGGSFGLAGGVAANGIAKWNGARWAPLDLGVHGAGPGEVLALAAFDDGNGEALYAGGTFTGAGAVAANNVARWNGVQWSAVGSGIAGRVQALAAFDDGSGSALYAAGQFTLAGGQAAVNVARWNGTSWSAAVALGSGTDQVFALTVFDDGSGPALYAGGQFRIAGVQFRVANWNGSEWKGVGSLGEPQSPFDPVCALAVYDAGSGPALYAGGYFRMAGGQQVNRIAVWDGSQWQRVGGSFGTNAPVFALAVHQVGPQAKLFAAGDFELIGSGGTSGLASWNGTEWWGEGGPGDGTRALAQYEVPFDDGNAPGPHLYLGGSFTTAGDSDLNGVMRWRAGAAVLEGGVDGAVYALAVDDSGPGEPVVYVGGAMTRVGHVPVGRIARWDGSEWSALGSGMSGAVLSLTLFDDGSGPGLVAGGEFTSAGGVPANRVARWDGVAWSPLGTGFPLQSVNELAVFDDGSGAALYCGAQDGLYLWNGTSWTHVASEWVGVTALAVLDLGDGPALYFGGVHVVVPGPFGIAHSAVGKWDGSAWSLVAEPLNGAVRSLTLFDDGTGPELYICGDFTSIEGVAANRIAKRDGASWAALGSGLNAQEVRALAVFQDGSGGARVLAAGGSFTAAGGTPASRIALWDGTAWSPLAGGVSAAVYELAVLEGTFERGPALLVGGAFVAFDSNERNFARWHCRDDVPPALFAPATVGRIEAFGDDPGEVVYFAVTASDDRDPAPRVVCVPPSGSFFPRGTTLVHCTATDAAGNESTAEFPVVVQVKVRGRAR